MRSFLVLRQMALMWAWLLLSPLAWAQARIETYPIDGAVISGLTGGAVFIGDKHAHLNALRDELAAAPVIAKGASVDGRADRWIAPAGVTVYLTGDLVDYKATLSTTDYQANLRMVDYLNHLATIARASRGAVIWTVGNHEIAYLRATVPGGRPDPRVLDLGNRLRTAILGSPGLPGFLRAVAVAGTDTMVSHGVIVWKLLESLALATATPLAQMKNPAVFARLANDALLYAAQRRVFASSIFKEDRGVAFRVASEEARNLSTLPFTKNIVGHDWLYAISSGEPLFFVKREGLRTLFLLCVDDGAGKLNASTGRELTTIRFLVRATHDGQCYGRSWRLR